MIFSYKHRFIFIKGRKVGGTSIEMALSPCCGPQDIITPISPVDELKRLSLGGQPRNFSRKDGVEAEYLALVKAGNIEAAIKTRVHSDTAYPFFNHMSLGRLESLLDPPSQDYTLVYNVRNPYAKIISLANMYISFHQYSGKPMEHALQDIKKSAANLFDTGRYLLARNHSLYATTRPYKARIILRQEQLATDFQNLQHQLKLGAIAADIPHAKQGSVRMGYHPRDVFTRAQLDTINTDFAAEFQAHGYARI